MNDSHTLCVREDASGDHDDSPTDSCSQHSFKALREESSTFAGTENEDPFRQGKGAGVGMLLLRVDQETVVIHCGCPSDQRAGINRSYSSSEEGAELGADRFGECHVIRHSFGGFGNVPFLSFPRP